MRDDDIQVIRSIPLFSTISNENFTELLQLAQLIRFPAQAHLINEGDPADFLQILMEGTIELFGASSGRETTVMVLRPVSTYNLSAVLEDATYLMSVRTLDDAKILMIPGNRVRTAMNVDSRFAHTMVTVLAERYRVLIRAFKEERLRTGLERLANYLLSANSQSLKTGQVVLTEDKRTLAALLGMTPEYLSRAFTKLKKYGVEVQGNKIILKNLEALNRIAKPNPLIDRKII